MFQLFLIRFLHICSYVQAAHNQNILDTRTTTRILLEESQLQNQLASMECIPGSIVSYHTTALFTCAKMFPNANVYCARPPMSVWNKAKHSHVWNFTACNNYEGLSVVYKYLEKEPSITTIDLTLN